MKIVASLLATCALTLAACGTSGSATRDTAAPPDPSTAAPETGGSTVDAAADGAAIDVIIVEIQSSRFSMPELRVPAGTTVRFINLDEFAHTVTSRDGSAMTFDSGGLGLADTFDITFDDAGEFAYFCQIHPTMRGVVIVE